MLNIDRGTHPALPPCLIRVKSKSDPSQIPVGSESNPVDSETNIQFCLRVSESTWGAQNRSNLLIPSIIPPAHICTCGVRAQWGPMTDRTWAIRNFRKMFAPSEKNPQIANLQWSVCLHVAQSGNTPPRFGFFRVDFEKSAERARFKLAKTLSKIEVVGDHQNRLRRP